MCVYVCVHIFYSNQKYYDLIAKCLQPSFSGSTERVGGSSVESEAANEGRRQGGEQAWDA